MDYRRKLLILLLATASTVLAGCMSVPSDRAPDAAAKPAARNSEPEARPDAVEADAEEAAAEETPVMALLRDRRRGDYPEIQTDVAGFTVTEQIRVDADTQARYEQALSLLSAQRLAEGIRLLTQITADAPEITAPYVDLGIAYARTGDLEAAAKALETAALLSPEHPVVHNELGIVYRRQGRFAEARSEYEKALAVFSDFHYARRNLGVLCDLYLDDLECALENYTAYLNSAGEDPEVDIWVADLTNRAAAGQ